MSQAIEAKKAFFKVNSPIETVSKKSVYFTSDLTRTVGVTILALFLEIMLKLYLERG